MNAESEQFCNPWEWDSSKRVLHTIPWKSRPDGSQFGKCLLCGAWGGLEHSQQVEIDRRIAGKRIRATRSDAPCTSSCWHAEGVVCICSCYGKNHGIGHNPES